MDIETLWKARLFHQWRSSPNIIALIEMFADPLQDTDNVVNYILGKLSIDLADGELLEFIGSWIGVQRPPAHEPRIFTLCREGEVGDPDNDHGFEDDSDPAVTTGGWLTTEKGLAAKDGSNMSDADFRYLIKQKASSYRTKATLRNLFNYLITFGARSKIYDDTAHQIEFDLVTHADLDEWQKWYVVSKGFKPGGISVEFWEQMRYKEPI
jgi:hypothetical protein